MTTSSAQHPLIPPDFPASWTELPYSQLLQLDRQAVKKAQLAALQLRFAQLKDKIKSLQVLADRQQISEINDIADAVLLFFDHRVYKAYPLSLLEKRNFKMLTQWLDRLTTHDLSKMDLTGLTTVDGWLDRLDEFGMIIGHSTGTTGKLSFIPRSKTEWPAWSNTYFECSRAATGQDARHEEILSISTGYRRGHHMMAKMNRIFQEASLGGERNRITYHDGAVSSDLMSLAGRLQAAEEKGELDKLEIDPAILEARKDMIEVGRNKEQNLGEWFAEIATQYKSRKIKMGGTFAELYRLAAGGGRYGNGYLM